MKARVFVTLKPSVFDPQGHTITEALHQMGYAGVGEVRQGKYFELDVDATSPSKPTLASEVAHRLLANPVAARSCWPSRSSRADSKPQRKRSE